MSVATHPLLSVRQLVVSLPTRAGLVRVVDGIDLDVAVGETVGIAGESGSGKTMAMLAILGLLPAGSIVTGQALLDDTDLLTLSDRELTQQRGKRIALIMQDPSSSLHPMLSVGHQLTDHVRYHLGIGRQEARGRAEALLRQVRIPDPAGSLNAYPHQFSGGMRQRIAIAIALACNPVLLIADEPTTGLDVTVQAGIMRLLADLREQSDLSLILITHDLGVISGLADTLAVMYAGRVVESGPTSMLLKSPQHPYSAALLDALPRADRPDMRLTPIRGFLGPPNERPSGCAFHPRCTYAEPSCAASVPLLVDTNRGHRHACFVAPFESTS